MEFQPALPVRGVTFYCRHNVIVEYVFQPTLPVRGVTGTS